MQVIVKKPSDPQQNQPQNLSESALQQLADAPVRITRSKTRALAQGASLTSLLQARAAGSRSSRRSGSLSAPLEPAQQPPSPLPDIDAPDKHNHLAECEYVNDVYAYFRRVEPKFRAPANYMENQVSSQNIVSS
jgi:cyclin B